MDRSVSAIVALVIGVFAMPARAVAAPNDLDADFGACGVAQASVGIATVLPLPDGDIVTVGDGLARYHADGRLDRRFGMHGVVASGGTPYVGGALQPDGKIVALGWHSSPDRDVALSRFLPDGSPDPTFGAGGVAVMRNPGSDETPSALVLQEDGKLVVAGVYGLGIGFADAFLLRRLPDGSADDAFGSDGRVPTLAGVQLLPTLAVTSEGALLTAGVQIVPGYGDYAVVERRRSDGELDPGFGVDGTTRLQLNGSYSVARAMAVQPDGAIVVAADGMEDWEFARFLANGNPDWTFGLGAVANAGVFFDDAHLYGFVMQSDGKLVLVGTGEDGWGIVVERLLPNGLPDESFAEPPARIDLTSGLDSGHAIGLAPDGKLVVGGLVDESPALLRFLGDCAGAECRSCPRCVPHPNFCGAPRRARLRVADATTSSANGVMTWRWSGSAASQGLGDPNDGYLVTLWEGCDQVASAAIGNAGACGAGSCWKTSARGSSYADRAFSLRLRTDVHGETAVVLRSAGGLAFPPASTPLTVVVASRRYRGPCWQAFFDRIRASGNGRFRAETTR